MGKATTRVKASDEQLLGRLARRNWVILAGLVFLSLLFQSRPFTLGVLSGGLVAIAGYHSLYRSLQRILAGPEQGAARRFQFGYLLRLGSLAAGLVVLIVVVKVHPIGLVAGLSVVVLNLLWTTLERVSQRGGDNPQ